MLSLLWRTPSNSNGSSHDRLHGDRQRVDTTRRSISARPQPRMWLSFHDKSMCWLFSTAIVRKTSGLYITSRYEKPKHMTTATSLGEVLVDVIICYSLVKVPLQSLLSHDSLQWSHQRQTCHAQESDVASAMARPTPHIACSMCLPRTLLTPVAIAASPDVSMQGVALP